MKRTYSGCFCLLLLLLNLTVFSQAGLRISNNSRFLVTADGKGFFYLGDTGWELFHRLTINEARSYLTNRASKGFNVVQCVLLAEMDGLTEPNANGDVPFHDLDVNRPNENYFRHVDEIIRIAESLGIYMSLLPTWGSWVMKENHPLFKPIQFFDENKARTYGLFLGRRYKQQPNIIWMLGGDRNPEGYEAVWTAMAKAIREGDGGSHLMSYHPTGGMSSSVVWHKSGLFDFNSVQTGHASRFVNSYDYISHDYELVPPRPTFDAETNYEDHPVSFHPSNGWFDDYDVRVSSYFSVFAGGFGITYGAHPIWQMNSGKKPIAYVRRTWKEAVDLPGSFQMRHLKNLIESRPFLTRIPDQSVLINTGRELVPSTTGMRHIAATRDGTKDKKDATFIMLYLPVGRGVAVNTTYIAADSLRCWWYDPRHGTAQLIGLIKNSGRFEPGWNSLPWHITAGPDWVLVIDDAGKQYPRPGGSFVDKIGAR
jgi:hypothetical protein